MNRNTSSIHQVDVEGERPKAGYERRIVSLVILTEWSLLHRVPGCCVAPRKDDLALLKHYIDGRTLDAATLGRVSQIVSRSRVKYWARYWVSRRENSRPSLLLFFEVATHLP
jgi:hypothetical protein